MHKMKMLNYCCQGKNGLRSTCGRLLPKGRKKGSELQAQGNAWVLYDAQGSPCYGVTWL